MKLGASRYFVYENRPTLSHFPFSEYTNAVSCTGKAILLQAWTGLEGSGRLRFPDFMTFGT